MAVLERGPTRASIARLADTKSLYLLGAEGGLYVANSRGNRYGISDPKRGNLYLR
jgi:hypothetical protein